MGKGYVILDELANFGAREWDRVLPLLEPQTLQDFVKRYSSMDDREKQANAPTASENTKNEAQSLYPEPFKGSASVWVTGNGRRIGVNCLSTPHLANIIEKLRETASKHTLNTPIVIHNWLHEYCITYSKLIIECQKRGIWYIDRAVVAPRKAKIQPIATQGKLDYVLNHILDRLDRIEAKSK